MKSLNEGVADCFGIIARRAAEAIKQEDGDYTESGLLHCGKCRTPKQCTVTYLGENRVVSCLCECRRKHEVAVREKERLSAKLQRAHELRSMGFEGIGYMTFRNDSGQRPELMRAARQYADNFDTYCREGKGLLLYGGVGSGKTFAAGCVVNELVGRGIPAAITNFSRIYNEAAGMFEGKQQYYNSFNRLALLVIDDLFAERDTKTMSETIHAIIDARSRAKLPIIVTTNLSAEKMRDKSDITQSRIMSRVLGMCHPIKVDGGDLRIERALDEFGETKRALKL